MESRAYYNEFDPAIAAWLRELINMNLIALGDVDERSIEDVTPNDLRGYTQHHFFAGIGGWSYALRLARWPDDRPVWTGSCPCQPFSSAGKGVGFDDERHLWPAFHHLIRECRPETVFGEQVASKDGLAWVDLVHDDMEGEGYAFTAFDLCASGVGASHIRQRLYWVAHSEVMHSDGGEGHREGLCEKMGILSKSGNGDPKEIGCGHRWEENKPTSLYVVDGLSDSLERMFVEVGTHGYGNAICAPLAAEFVRLYTEV